MLHVCTCPACTHTHIWQFYFLCTSSMAYAFVYIQRYWSKNLCLNATCEPSADSCCHIMECCCVWISLCIGKVCSAMLPNLPPLQHTDAHACLCFQPTLNGFSDSSTNCHTVLTHSPVSIATMVIIMLGKWLGYNVCPPKKHL